ncbi:ABC transporter substrate-binding protein [Nocardioides anomalus]|uniref:ABC transporter substrate-binding protein n=1 Tax=Nocardioides anomalus TaxID=2712223 RepID=A0A6G6WDM4_9ACTN|nr:ABC transporter substrate-binding protein [Nocardioides anomalus]QIG43306.1 ABC transporter substrate-binding protein [Nocardioides anomalus]
MSSRRRLASALLLLTGAALVAGCGQDAPDRPSTPERGAAAEGDAFPVTLQHEYGETTVPEQPQRVVTVGVTEQDVVLQLGVVPVAVTEWYGDQPSATWPWAHDLLDGAEPEVLRTDDGFELEKIAALAPDLIIGTNAGLSRQEYELMAQIAPTVPSVPPGTGVTPFFSSWREQTVQIARALGREDDGRRIVADLEARYAEVAAAHPEWAGRTATFAQGGPYDGLLYVYPPGLSTDFLTDLGFTITTGFESFVPQVGAQAEISAENVSLIDADVVVFATESAEQFEQLQGFGTLGTLDAVTGGRSVYTDEVLAGALYFDTPLAHAYVLDHLVPALELAAAGRAPREYPA